MSEEATRWEENLEKFHSDGHETREEAVACYHEYRLDCELNLNHRRMSGMKRVCRAEGCKTYTDRLADFSGHPVVLCEEHQSREDAKAVVPAASMTFGSW